MKNLSQIKNFSRLFNALVVAATLLLVNSVHASELDNEKKLIEQARMSFARNLPKGVIIRVNPADKTVAILHSSDSLNKKNTATYIKKNSNNFKLATSKQLEGELDRDSSRSSWFFCPWNYSGGYYPGYGYGFGNYQPTYYYGGQYYQYQSYYQYNWGGYNYYYYRNPYYCSYWC